MKKQTPQTTQNPTGRKRSNTIYEEIEVSAATPSPQPVELSIDGVFRLLESKADEFMNSSSAESTLDSLKAAILNFLDQRIEKTKDPKDLEMLKNFKKTELNNFLEILEVVYMPPSSPRSASPTKKQKG